MPGSVSSRRRPAAKRAPERLSLAGALFGGTKQRVLSLLFGRPDRGFYVHRFGATPEAS